MVLETKLNDWIRSLVSLARLSPPDLILVSSEGEQFTSWALLLSLYSSSMASLLQSSSVPQLKDTMAISVPATTTELSQLLNCLETHREVEDSTVATRP